MISIKRLRTANNYPQQGTIVKTTYKGQVYNALVHARREGHDQYVCTVVLRHSDERPVVVRKRCEIDIIRVYGRVA